MGGGWYCVLQNRIVDRDSPSLTSDCMGTLIRTAFPLTDGIEGEIGCMKKKDV